MIPTKEEWNKALGERHGEVLQKNFSEAVVAVCGLGGLGSNIAIALARAGVGKLILIDFDCVDITNLHRQQYKVNQIGMNKTDALTENLKEIAPYIELETHTERVTEENIGLAVDLLNALFDAIDLFLALFALLFQLLEVNGLILGLFFFLFGLGFLLGRIVLQGQYTQTLDFAFFEELVIVAAIIEDLAVLHLPDAGGEAVDEIAVMGNENHGFGEIIDRVLQPFA